MSPRQAVPVANLRAELEESTVHMFRALNDRKRLMVLEGGIARRLRPAEDSHSAVLREVMSDELVRRQALPGRSGQSARP